MKKLLFSVTRKDMNMTFFSGHGAGGQNRNRHMNCVRINHKDSGAMVTGQSNKAKQSNISEAISNLVNHPKFKVWHARRTQECMNNQTTEEKVEEEMCASNLKIEQLINEKWEPMLEQKITN